MKQTYRTILIIAILIVTIIFGILFVLDYSYTRSAARLAIKLQKINVGMSFENVLDILGKPSRSFTKESEIKEWGPIKTENIVKECNMHWFAYLGSPHRFIVVYESKKTNKVELVTWIPM